MNEDLRKRYQFIRDDLIALYEQIKNGYDAESNNYILPDSEFHRYYNILWCIPYQLDYLMDTIDTYWQADREVFHEEVNKRVEACKRSNNERYDFYHRMFNE